MTNGIGAYDAQGAALRTRGYYVLPIIPGTKQPGYYIPSENRFEGMENWNHPQRPMETTPQPGAGVGLRLGKQPDGTFVIAIDWDNDDAFIAAMDTPLWSQFNKAGKRGGTTFHQSAHEISSRDFKIGARMAVQVLSTGKQTVLPPTPHPETDRPYIYGDDSATLVTSCASELPLLPDNYLEIIEALLRPLGYEPEPEPEANGHDAAYDGDDQFQMLNNAALRKLDAWVPELGLYGLKRGRGPYATYRAVASFRESLSGKELKDRELRLSIVRAGIRDYGEDKGYSPIQLVMVCLNDAFGEAVDWLRERVLPRGPDIDFDAINDTPPVGDNTPRTEEPPPDGQPKKRRFILTPFVRIDPLSLPPRKWLYAKHYQRKIVSATIAPGGTGKSSLNLVDAIVMATLRELLGDLPDEQCRVWVHNGEETREELDRRILAICQLYGIPQEELEGWLWLTSGTEVPLRVARGYNDLKLDKGLISDIKGHILDNRIDVAMFDPLVALHGTKESDNDKMNSVMEIFKGIAFECNASIEISHHTRKGPPGNGDDKTSDDGRGATAVRDAVRGMRILNAMSDTDAGKLGFNEYQRQLYFRVDRGKANMLKPAKAATWRKFESVILPNGDDVGVVTPWAFPGGDVLDRTKGAVDDDALFLALLDRFTAEGRTVNATSGANYAPAAFAKEPEAVLGEVNKHRLAAAMRRLFADKKIKAVPHKTRGYEGTRITRV